MTFTEIRADQLAFERQCSGKKGYPTEDRAIKVKNKIRWDRGVVLRVYGCSLCGCWHLTHMQKES